MSDPLEQAQNCLAIHSVNLRESQVEVRADIVPWDYDRSQSQAQSYRDVGRVQEVELQPEDERKSLWEYRFDYALGVRLVNSDTDDAGDDPTVDLEIVAVFQARYLCKRQLEENELSAFAKDNVGYHVWPYWREFVQTTCNRMGMLSPIEIPMYRIVRD